MDKQHIRITFLAHPHRLPTPHRNSLDRVADSVSKSGISTSSNPESWVEVVVAKIKLGLDGALGVAGAQAPSANASTINKLNNKENLHFIIIS
jgi:hypothetical protein